MTGETVNTPAVMVVVPELDGKGGVANYYRTVGLNKVPGVRYFTIYEDKSRLTNPLLKILWLLRRFAQFWAELASSDVVHINPSMDPKSYYRDFVFAWLTLLRGRRLATLWHGWEDRLAERIQHSAMQRWLFHKTYGSSHGTIVLGQVFEDKIEELGGVTGKYFHVTPPIDTDKLNGFDLEKRLSADRVRSKLMFMARLEHAKGAHIAVSALQHLNERFPERGYQLWVAGDGPEYDSLQEMVSQLGTKGVIFTGRLSDAEKYDLLKTVDVFLYPTCFGEGLPTVVLEAMLCGLPIVTRPVGAIAEQVEHEVNGLLTEETTGERFAEFVQQLSGARAQYEEMSRTNRRKAIHTYSAEVVRDKLLAIYSAVRAV